VEIYPVEFLPSIGEHPNQCQRSRQNIANSAKRSARSASSRATRYYGAIERGEFNLTIETVLRVAAGLQIAAWKILQRAEL